MDYIFAAALLPIAIQIIVWFVFGVRFNVSKLGRLADQFRVLSDKATEIKSCNKDNILIYEKLLNDATPKCFMEKWNYMKDQVDNYYNGMFIPSAETFFPYDALIETEGGRSRIKTMWYCFVLFAFLSLSLPITIALALYPDQLILAFEYGLAAVSLMAVGQLLFVLISERYFHRAKKQYDRFISEFNRITPVADNGSALILDAIYKNKKVIEINTSKIINKFDEFAKEDILPVLTQSLKMISEKQENGMKILAAEFVDHLTSTLDLSMTSLSETINEVQSGLNKLNEGLTSNTADLSNVLVEQRKTLEEAANMLQSSRQAQMEALAQMKEIQMQAVNTGEALKDQIGNMIETVDKLEDQNTVFTQQAGDLITKAMDIQQQVGDQLVSYKGWIDAMMKEEATRIEGIAQNINESMALTGNQISESIKEQNTAFAQQAGDLIMKATDIQQQVGDQLVSFRDWVDIMLREETAIMENITQGIKESMSATCGDMAASLKEQNTSFAQQADDLIMKATDIQKQVGDQLLSYKEWIEAMIKEETETMDGISHNIKDSLAAAGGEIAIAIKETTGDNAEAIQKIAEQASLLRSDYDNYFSRLENYSRDTYEQMDYHMQNVIAKVTEEVEKLLGENVKTSLSVLDDYRNSNTELLATFKEQANSFSLYASEISLDVGELSENLKNSVSTFSDSLQNSVVATMNEFDSGLAELSKRIANTVESICDAVEALPSAIEKK